MEVREAKTDEEILSCWPTLKGLRPHLKEEEFLTRIREVQAGGYHLMFVQDPEDNVTKSILGYRLLDNLYSGKTLYVDDLGTLEGGRGKGLAGALLDWVKKFAKETGNNTLSLDSEYDRNNAHRLYLTKRFSLSGHHLSQEL